MENVEITKTNRLLEVINAITHKYYYLIYGRLYNENKTIYRKFKFVISFNIFDVQEYLNKDIITNNDLKEFVQANAWNFIHINYTSYDTSIEFINECNKTINDYNNR